ncbi:hypothetical protein [Hymenobacter sp. APR13]|uniref:hypothetical protein n=1 Tax=Hymenobacter sp. APR13 TaxID=1356852 RepID=UPI0004E094AE|nr:hypothetical protein [Hymenobacter sp. APR13]AII51327.1 hypothetical protein N008_04930 [Hymenobacter sp. APR13]
MAKQDYGNWGLPAPAGATVAQCQQQLLQQLKGGGALSSSDKEGHRTLCYYRQAFLFVSVGDEGTQVLHLPTDEHLLTYVWRDSRGKLVLQHGHYHWNYDLTEAETLERWQALVTRVTPFSEGQQRFVASVLRDFGALGQ